MNKREIRSSLHIPINTSTQTCYNSCVNKIDVYATLRNKRPCIQRNLHKRRWEMYFEENELHYVPKDIDGR